MQVEGSQAKQGLATAAYVFAALALGLALLLAAASPVAAKAKDNRTTISLLPQAGKKLGAKRVVLVSKGIARGRGSQVWLPITGGKVGAKQARLRHGGALELKVRVAGERPRLLKLSRFESILNGRSGRLLARPSGGRKSITFFKLRFGARALKLDAGAKTARLSNARLLLSPQGRRVLRKALGLTQIKAAPIARLTTRAALKKLELPDVVPPPLKPLPPEPPLLARPDTAVDVTSAEATWCIRASWIRYIGNGTVSNGASHETPFVVNKGNKSQVCDQKRAEVTSAATAYRYYFTFKNGWYDPVSGKAALYFQGRVGFRYPARGIDLGFNDLEVEINGAETRTIFRMEGHDGTEIQSHRTVFTDNGDPLPVLDTSEPGKVKTGQMPGWLASGTEAGVFADFYLPPNHDFGWISAEFEVPQDA